MQGKKPNVAIIGMGSGGFSLARIFSEEQDTNVVGVANRRQDTPGMMWAKQHGIFTTPDYRELINRPDVNIVIDASGNREVEDYLIALDRKDLEVVKGLSAMMMWRMVEEWEDKERETYKRLAEQQYLYDIGITLTNAQNSQEALKLIVTAAMDLLEMAAGSVALFDEEAGLMRMAYSIGFQSDASAGGMVWSITPGGFTDHILNSDEPVTVEDITKAREFDTSRLEKEGFRSLIAIPLKVGGKLVGILYADDFEPKKFTTSDVNLMGLLGTMAASAIEKILGLEAAEKRADTDGLTRLYNQRYFKAALVSELKRASRYNENLSLIMLDVDHFKKYNDTHGHPAGDAALRKVAYILGQSARETDILARYGGEEFAMILPNTEESSAKIVAERMCRGVMEEKFDGEESQPGGKVTISIGVASFPEALSDPTDFNQLLHLADQALYASKAGGRNRVTLARG